MKLEDTGTTNEYIIEARKRWRSLRKRLAVRSLPWKVDGASEPKPVRAIAYRGVSPAKKSGRFRAQIASTKGSTITVGTFDSASDAARAFDRRAREIHGATYQGFNFPEEQGAGA
jgi:hypothetical protein